MAKVTKKDLESHNEELKKQIKDLATTKDSLISYNAQLAAKLHDERIQRQATESQARDEKDLRSEALTELVNLEEDLQAWNNDLMAAHKDGEKASTIANHFANVLGAISSYGGTNIAIPRAIAEAALLDVTKDIPHV